MLCANEEGQCLIKVICVVTRQLGEQELGHIQQEAAKLCPSCVVV